MTGTLDTAVQTPVCAPFLSVTFPGPCTYLCCWLSMYYCYLVIHCMKALEYVFTASLTPISFFRIRIRLIHWLLRENILFIYFFALSIKFFVENSDTGGTLVPPHDRSQNAAWTGRAGRLEGGPVCGQNSPDRAFWKCVCKERNPVTGTLGIWTENTASLHVLALSLPFDLLSLHPPRNFSPRAFSSLVDELLSSAQWIVSKHNTVLPSLPQI